MLLQQNENTSISVEISPKYSPNDICCLWEVQVFTGNKKKNYSCDDRTA